MRILSTGVLIAMSLLPAVGLQVSLGRAAASDGPCSIDSLTADPDVTTAGQGVQITATVTNKTDRACQCLVRIVVWESRGGEWRNPTRPTTASLMAPAGRSATGHIAYVPQNATRYKAKAE